MTELKGLGGLPDIPSHLDYTEDHSDVAPLIAQTALAPRVAAASGGAPRATSPTGNGA